MRKNPTPEFYSRRAMLTRCYNPKVKDYKWYGGKGVAVCDRWRYGENGKTGLDCFVEDMGPRPEKHSLDRYPNNSGNYEPGNCRWATIKQQARNRRTCRMLTHNGETKPLVAWAEQAGVSFQCFDRRLREGWTMDEALDPLVCAHASRELPALRRREKFCLISDGNCHWFLCPAERRDEAEEVMERISGYWSDNFDCDEPPPELPDYLETLDGGPGRITFEAPVTHSDKQT